MSWFTEIAGRAENILNKIDKNAASVLQQQQKKEDLDLLVEIKCEETNGHSPKKNISIESLTKSLSPKKILSQDNGTDRNKSISNVTEPIGKSFSNSNSRRSSFSSHSSRADGTVIEKSVGITIEPLTNTSVQTNISLEYELAAVKIVLNEIKAERDELKCELDSVLEQIKKSNSQSIIKELEEMCSRLTDEKEALIFKCDVIEKANANYIKSISDLETKMFKLHQAEIDYSAKLEWAKQESDQAVNELQQYRARAQSTLQSKEKLIEQLKTESRNYSDGNITNISTNSFEVEQLKSENIGLNEEITLLNNQLQQIRSYVDKLENIQKEQQIEFEKKINLVNNNLKQKERKWITYEDEYKAQVRELSMVREEMNRLQMEYSMKINEKETELVHLRSKISQTAGTKKSIGLEERVQSLTQSLVQKQNSLESVTADRNALRFQLEKIEHQHRNTMLQLRQQRPQAISVNDTDDVKAQVPGFLQENPFDTDVARRVKRVYSTLDSVGVRFGVFLRRYPLIRILAIFYVVLLHLWVMVVLCTSTPN